MGRPYTAAMNIETEIARLYIIWGAVSLIGTIVGCWITYMLIRAAVRDGIRESGLIEATMRGTRPTKLPEWERKPD